MKIGLLNFYSTRNLGDCAIYASLAALSPAGLVFAQRVDCNPVLVPGIEYVASLDDCKAFVSVGGDVFNNGRPRLVARRFLTNVAAIRRRAERTISFGQSIPPSCRGIARRYLASSLRRLAAVAVRDTETHSALKQLKADCLLTFDTAFTLSAGVSACAAAAEIYAAEDLDPVRTIVLSIREHSSLYEGSAAAQERALLDLIGVLQGRGHQTAIVIQADNGVADTDWPLALRIKAALPETRILDPFAAAPPLAPHEVFAGILAIANGVAAVRYHGAVLRLTSGRPAYALHYSNKGADLCTRLGIGGGRIGMLPVNEMVKGIEASLSRSFDYAPIAQNVRDTFALCLSRLQ